MLQVGKWNLRDANNQGHKTKQWWSRVNSKIT